VCHYPALFTPELASGSRFLTPRILSIAKKAGQPTARKHGPTPVNFSNSSQLEKLAVTPHEFATCDGIAIHEDREKHVSSPSATRC
jgi:hypothetical protein